MTTLLSPYLSTSEADENALRLLVDNLTPDQRKDFDKHSRFHVVGSMTGRTYKIKAGTMQNVYLLDGDEYSTEVFGLCFGPNNLSLAGDIMLCQKIALECFEREALEVAIVFNSPWTMHDSWSYGG